MSLQVGQTAPDFTAPSTDGPITLSKIQKEPIVLFFYPKDDTPGCANEVCSIRDNYEAMIALGATILGLSVDSLAKHEKFREKHSLPFPLISDESLEIVDAYGLYGEKKFMGNTYMGTTRATFVLDKNLKILKAWPKVSPAKHGIEILQYLKELQLSGNE